MDRHKSTVFYKEKQRILITYLALLVLTLAQIPIMVVFNMPPDWIYLPQLATALLFTLLFLISYSNPVEWGWLMFRRRKKNIHEAVEAQMAYEESLYYSKPEALLDLGEARNELNARRRIELPKTDPSKSRLAEGVLQCPQCDTPYVFDKSSPICARCGTRLHHGVRL